jgi:hypothetical protein
MVDKLKKKYGSCGFSGAYDALKKEKHHSIMGKKTEEAHRKFRSV